MNANTIGSGQVNFLFTQFNVSIQEISNILKVSEF